MTTSLESGEAELAYVELEEKGLLVQTSVGTWEHSKSEVAQLLREFLNEIHTVASFLIRTEKDTRSALSRIADAKKLDMVFLLWQSDQRDTHVCPICKRLGNSGKIIEIENYRISPFHYSCGAVSPMPVTRDFALSELAKR